MSTDLAADLKTLLLVCLLALLLDPPDPLSDSGPPNPESGSETRERSAGGLGHTQYWFLFRRGCPGVPGAVKLLSPLHVVGLGGGKLLG